MDKKTIFSKIKKILIIAFVMISSLGIGYLGTAFAIKNVSVKATGVFNFDGILEFLTDTTIDGTVSVRMRSKYKDYDQKIEIPSTVEREGYIFTVVEIKDEGFADCQNLPEIYIPSSVTKIGSSAFSNCVNLKTVTFEDGVKEIGDQAFYKCSGLTSITFPASLNSLSITALQDCYSLKDVEVAGENAKYKSINNSIYEGTKLVAGGTDGNIESTTTEIGEYAFAGRTVNHFTIPASVNKIGAYAFYNSDGSHPTYVSFEKTEGWTANNIAITDLEDVDIAMQQLCLAYYAYEWVWAYNPGEYSIIKYTKLSDSDVSVSVNAENYTNETIIQIPAVVRVDTSLTTVFEGFDFDVDDKGIFTVTEVAKDGFKGKEGNEIDGTMSDDWRDWADDWYDWANIKNVELPETIVTINEGAFEYCINLEIVKLGKNLKTIGYNAFSCCKTLNDIIIPSNVETIDSVAFWECTSLTEIIIPSSVKTIGRLAFEGCTELKTVELNEGLENIRRGAFNGCTALVGSITIPSTVKTIDHSAFVSCALTNVVIKEGVEYIGNHAFAGICIENITIPSSVLVVGGRAFQGCENLVSITIESGEADIYDSAFQGCKSLANATINGANIIGNSIFLGCTNLETVDIKAKGLGGSVFYDCTNLETAKLDVPEIDETVFTFCENLSSIEIGASVSKINPKAFTFCTYLENISVDSGNDIYSDLESNSIYSGTKLVVGGVSSTIKTTTTEIGQYAFGYRGITIIQIPNSVTEVDEYAFVGCQLTSVTFPTSGALTIKEYAFYDCRALEGTLTLPETVKEVSNNAFGNCTEITKVDSKAQVIGATAFFYCTGITEVVISNCTTIGESAFTCTATQNDDGNWVSNSQITTATISAQTIGAHAFDCCNNLTTLTLQDGTVNIGDHAFGAIGITDLVIPDSVEKIEKCAFGACGSLATVTIGKSVRNIGWRAFGDTALTYVRFGDGYDWFVVETENEMPVTTAGAWESLYILNGNRYTELVSYVNYYWTKEPSSSVLSNCFTFTDEGDYTASIKASSSINLITVRIPRFVTMNDNVYTVTEIPDNAFHGGFIEACKNIKSFYIPQGVTSINSTAFLFCDRSSGFDVNSNNENYKASNYSLYSKKSDLTLTFAWNHSRFSIDTSTVIIGVNAFRDCSNITSISLSSCENLTRIEKEAFRGSSLQSIDTGAATTIGQYAFQDCLSLTTASLDGFVTIYEYAFKGCNSLAQVTGLKYFANSEGIITKTTAIYRDGIMVDYIGQDADDATWCAEKLIGDYCDCIWKLYLTPYNPSA